MQTIAGTVGTGNIAGVAGAIALGGPGAVFWMWCSALLGMCTKFSEVTLAVHFRVKNEHGDWVGGPMYYIKNGTNFSVTLPILFTPPTKTIATKTAIIIPIPNLSPIDA